MRSPRAYRADASAELTPPDGRGDRGKPQGRAAAAFCLIDIAGCSELEPAAPTLVGCPEFIYQMHAVRKSHGDKLILDNVTLAFLPGAKIGVVGPNGTGKSTLLRMMAGAEQPSNGDARLMPGFTVGLLDQEPALDESKTVLGNVEEGVAETKALLDRYNEIAEQMATDYSDALLDEMGRLQEQLDHRQRLGPGQPARAGDGRAALPAAGRGRQRPVRRRAAPGRAVQAATGSSPTCCCSTSRPTTWTPRACSGWSSTWRSTRAPWSRSPTTGTSWTTSPQLDPRARPRARLPVRGQLLDLPGDQGRPAEGRGPEGRQAAASGCEDELEWVRSSPRARQAKSQARLQRYEEMAAEADADPQAGLRGDPDPARAPAGQPGGRGRTT